MTDTPPDAGRVVSQLAAAGKSIRLGPGVVGKSSYVMLGLVVMWCIIASQVSDALVKNCFLAGIGVIATFAAMVWVFATHKFAENNPSLALLEGAELIEFKKFESESKSGAVEGGRLETEDSPPLIGRRGRG